MDYIYIFTFLAGIPLIWNILYSLRFESNFKSGKVWQIRVAYVIVTIVVSHLLASSISEFINNFYALF